MGRSSSRLLTAAAVVAALAGLAVAGRLLAPGMDAGSPATSTVGGVASVPPLSVDTSIMPEDALVPRAVGRTLAQARAVMLAAGLPSRAAPSDPRAPGAVVVAQEPTAGERVPPGSPVEFRTRSDVWPNGVPRRLRLGDGATTAAYRVVAADPVHDPLTVTVTMPRTVALRVWLETGPGRRVPALDTGNPRRCREAGRQRRCQARFDALGREAPGVWAVRLAKGSPPAVVVRVTVEFTRL